MRKIFTYLLITILLIGSGLTVDWQKASAQSSGELRQNINKLEERQSELNEKRNNVSSKRENIEDKITNNLNKQHSVANDINAIDQQLNDTRNKIAAKENKIVATNNEIKDLKQQIKEINSKIDQLQKEIIASKKRIKKREELLKNRLRAIQSNGGNMQYMEVILGAKSFGDFISRTSAVNTIMDQDKHIMEVNIAEKRELEIKKEEVVNKKKEIENKKAVVEEKKKSLESQRRELVSLKSQLGGQMAEKENLMAKLEEKHKHLEKYKMSLAEQQQVLNDQAAVIAQAKRDAKNKLSQLSKNSSSNLNSGGSGIFIWPASGRFSSGFGPRPAPYGYHKGIDIAASTGTTIRAASSGVVTRSAWSNSYGNVIYIYHPQYDKTTVYAHMSNRTVGLGQSVASGQRIGAMGNTGNSYGSHLHFEVHNGGWNYNSGINPMAYLK